MLNKKIGYMICETASSEPVAPVIVGEKNDRVTIETVLQDMDVKNRNGRYYAGKELIPAIDDKRVKELIDAKSFFGEAGHPASKDIGRQQTIDPTNISHNILKIWTDGNLVKGHVKGTPNKLGKHFNDLVLDGTKVAFSLRALGTVNNTSKGAEVENIKIITYDWVIYPSHQKAYMQNIVSESALMGDQEFRKNDKGLFVPIYNEQVNKYIQQESYNLKSVLESFDMLYESIEVVNNGKQVRVMDKEGSIFMINLESYIQNEIMNYCYR